MEIIVKSKNWIILGVIFLLTLIIPYAYYMRIGTKKMLTEEQLKFVEIANKKVRELGTAVETENVYYDVNNEKWKKELSLLIKEDPNYNERFKILEGRDYQTVMYSPKGKYTLGGVFWIFIDRETKDVITFLVEQ